MNKKLSDAAQAVVIRFAQRRGIAPSEINTFVNPQLDPRKYALADADKAAARLQRAIENHEAVVLFGDYDADGICATAILLRFLRECTTLRPLWKLPDRRADPYGLDADSAKKLVAEFNPALIVCLDNGTNSTHAIAWLRQQGVDTVIIDHHPLATPAHAAVATINPKAHPAVEDDDLADLCGAGLSLLFCHHLAAKWNCGVQWNRDVATMLAGIATLADSVPLGKTNRAIAKSAMKLLNTPAALRRCIGLQALIPDDGQRIFQRRIQFEIVPKLNALGRLESAAPGVRLLTTADPAEADEIAQHCENLNQARKLIQQKTVAMAVDQGRELLDRSPSVPILICAHHDWISGVCGPAASRVAEKLGRSAILLGPDITPGQWKGSGRSHHADDIGGWLNAVREKGFIQRGGGHPGAVGLVACSEQIIKLWAAAEQLPMPHISDYEPKQELVGELNELPPEHWLQVLEAIAPCGPGNPEPLIAARSAWLTKAPVALLLRDSNKPWAWRGEFKVGRQTIAAIWRDVEQAAAQWRQGGTYDLQLELSAKQIKGRIFSNWSVAKSEPTSPQA